MLASWRYSPDEASPGKLTHPKDYFELVLIIPALTVCCRSGCPVMWWCKVESLKSGNGGMEAGWLRAHIKAVEAKSAAVPSTYSALQNQFEPRTAPHHWVKVWHHTAVAQSDTSLSGFTIPHGLGQLLGKSAICKTLSMLHVSQLCWAAQLPPYHLFCSSSCGSHHY